MKTTKTKITFPDGTILEQELIEDQYTEETTCNKEYEDISNDEYHKLIEKLLDYSDTPSNLWGELKPHKFPEWLQNQGKSIPPQCKNCGNYNKGACWCTLGNQITY